MRPGQLYKTVPASANRSRHFDRLDVVGWYKSAERFWVGPARPTTRAPPFGKLPALSDCTSPQAVVKTVATLCNASKEKFGGSPRQVRV